MAKSRTYTVYVYIACVFLIIFFLYINPIQQIQQIQPIQQIQSIQQIQPIQTIISNGESRYNIAPQPLRDWRAHQGINIPTQGFPESFQSVGAVTIDDKILPIYGRKINRDQWNYYTRTDTYNPIPIPIHFKKRDCMDTGCQELMSGDNIKVEIMNKHGTANIYKYNGPKYIGFI